MKKDDAYDIHGGVGEQGKYGGSGVDWKERRAMGAEVILTLSVIQPEGFRGF